MTSETPGRDDLTGYQARLVRRLLKRFGRRPGALLAVGMGLGKTVTTATVLRDLLDAFEVRKVLIVAPLRVAQMTWPQEFGKWRHLRAIRWKSLAGTRVGQKVTPEQREKWLREALTDPLCEVVIVNRENLAWLYKAVGGEKGWPFDFMVYDESSRLKEGSKRTGSKRLSEFGALAKVRPRMSGVIELTGTPAPKGLIDLWGQFYIIDMGRRLGTTKTAFLSRWFEADYMGWNYTPRPNAEREIMERVSDVMISLKAEDVLQLPPVVYSNVMVDLTKKEWEDYRRLEREMALEEHDIEAVNRGVLTFKLLQYANGHVYRTDESVYPPKREAIRFHDAKLDALDSIVAELNGANLLVAYTFKFDLAAIRKRYPKARLATDEGVLDAWNAGDVPMLLAHPASIGHGMNIQFGGHNIAWFGLTPSLELYQQFNARLPRPGQTAERVFVRHILARGTFDEKLISVLAERDATQDRITEAVRWRLEVARNAA